MPKTVCNYLRGVWFSIFFFNCYTVRNLYAAAPIAPTKAANVLQEVLTLLLLLQQTTMMILEWGWIGLLGLAGLKREETTEKTNLIGAFAYLTIY
jgi:hypothetical protein